jgi:hypothetical protein
MRRLLMGILLAAAMGAAPAVRAQEGAGPITLGGVAVLQFRAPAGGFTPKERALQLQERVVEILSRPDLRPEDVRLVTNEGGRSVTIWVGDLPLVTATEADARANASTPEQLAAIWAENFRRGYAEARPIRPPGG